MLLRYRESKRCGFPMFPVKNAADLSNAQLWLLHWLQVYDWAFSLTPNEKPADYIIENDELFDEWQRNYTAHKMRELKATPGTSKGAASHSNVMTNF